MEAIGVYLLAYLVQLPFIAALGSPFLLIAWGVAKISRGKMSDARRRWLWVAIGLIGITPLIGAHASMMPAIYFLFSGRETALPALEFLAIAQVLWFFVWLGSHQLFRRPG